jgi:uncharacterized protein YraI
MKIRLTPRWFFILIPALLMAAGLACSSENLLGKSAKPPTVVILSPQNGEKVTVGKEITVQSISTDARSVVRVELWVDNQMMRQDVSPDQGTTLTALQTWTPETAGNHVLEVRAYNADGLRNDPLLVSVLAEGQAAAAASSASSATEAGLAPASEGATPTPPEAAPTASQPLFTSNRDLNVRSGPGTNFPIIGLLKKGGSVEITGKSADGSWWQIVVSFAPEGKGWVSAAYGQAVNADAIGAVTSPATPTPAATPTSTPIPPTSTPTVSPLPVIKSFNADKTTIVSGETVKLSWEITGQTEAFLYPGGESGVGGTSDRSVAPADTITYRLVARNAAGEVEKKLTINVNSPASAILYNFAQKASSAEWSNEIDDLLPFNGSDSDSKGFVILRENVTLEDGSVVGRALETHPRWVTDGGIKGEYAVNVTIQDGDVFRTQIGFIQGAGGGNAKWVLSYMDGGIPVDLASKTKAMNNHLTPFNVDLSALSGRTVHFVLSVWANGSAGQDWAIWLNPRIERP